MAAQIPLTRKDLDVMRCSDPTCHSTHPVLYIHAACHPRQPLEASYDKRTGVMTTACAKCGRTIMEFAVEGGEISMSEVTQKPEEEAAAEAEVEAEAEDEETEEGEEAEEAEEAEEPKA